MRHGSSTRHLLPRTDVFTDPELPTLPELHTTLAEYAAAVDQLATDLDDLRFEVHDAAREDLCVAMDDVSAAWASLMRAKRTVAEVLGVQRR